ncbi:elongator complex protein 6 isoform X3 [Pseudopipra pipra]|uniref:elongator complex protein 6 isoform X3 n=1 Tax=Pseudopipra pipra TaxID=415032 RepID=UPI003138B2A1
MEVTLELNTLALCDNRQVDAAAGQRDGRQLPGAPLPVLLPASWLQGLLRGPAPVLQSLQHRGTEAGESLAAGSAFQLQGVNLTAAKERGQLVFLEGLKSCLDLVFGEEEEQPGQPSPLLFLSESPSDLRALFHFVRVSLSAAGSEACAGPVLLLDDLSVLLGLGATPVALLDFIHYCRALVCCQLKGNVVVLVHSSEDSEDEENELVVNSLCHHSDLILWAEGLATGFCKDVHGQLKIIQRVSLQQAGEQDLVQIYQYKIQDRNVTFFARGLSAAVL